MASKKQSVVNEELKNADLMTILSNGGTSSVFKKQKLIDYSYMTGISVIDYALGYEVLVKENKIVIKKRTCLGLQAGSINVITGVTGTYKSTLGELISANIAKKYGGNVVHYDVENRLVLQRLKQITKLGDDWFDGEFPRYALKGGAIGYDTLQNDITEIYLNKMSHKDILEKDTGEVDENNKPIILMPPTVIFLDSISDVIAKEYDVNDKKAMAGVDELRSNTYGMQAAKTLRGVLTDILPMIKEANAIIILIAHKSDNVSMNACTPPKKQFTYGKVSEKIAGGKALEYNASSFLNFSPEHSQDLRFHIDTDGFEGNAILFEPTKISTNESGDEKSGRAFRIIIDKRNNGCDNIRTLIELLKAKGRLKGNRAGWVVLNRNGEPISDKFTWKNVYKEFENNRKLCKTFMQAAKEELEEYVAKAEDVAGQIKPFDLNEMLNDIPDEE